MPTFTKHLNLRKPEENDFYNQETEQCENWDKLDNWSEEIDNKTIGATSEAPGIVKYGTDVSTALEGHRMAQIQGVEKCGGDVQTPGVKKVGYSYWCTANKDFYVCKVENSLNYIDDAYFDAFSNYSLLGKLQNLIKTTIITANKFYDVEYESKYSYTFPTSKKQILSIMPYDVSFAASETGTCIDNKTIEISVTRFGPSVGQTDQTVKAVIKYID